MTQTDATAPATLEVKGLRAAVGDREILRGIDLTVQQGQIHALMGPNGSGKSTLSNVIMGRPGYRILEGSVTFNGEDITTLPPDQLDAVRADMRATGLTGEVRLVRPGWTPGNAVVEKSMSDVIASVKAGGTIAAPLREASVFPPMVSHMVGVGEETGALDTMLSKIADFYDDEVAAAVKALTSIMEPVMIILVGGIVGVIVVSMYLPLFAVYNSIK